MVKSKLRNIIFIPRSFFSTVKRFYVIVIDCVDDFSLDKFTYNKCLNKSLLFKCAEDESLNYGRCFNKMALDGSLATCSMNQSQLEQVGFWKTSFPSADYWRLVVVLVVVVVVFMKAVKHCVEYGLQLVAFL